MNHVEVSRFVVKEFQTSEAMKTLRTNLQFCGSNIKTVALTSFAAGEGKSTIAFQLCASLAQMGKRVVLLDTDLRKSTLTNRLRIKGKVEGLSHYLSGMANADELINETDIPGFYILFSGKLVPNAAELLGTPSFERLVTALRETFDYVIIDTAPLGQVIDCAVILPVVDGTMIVLDVNNNSYKLARRMKAQMEKAGAKILGVVLNGVDFKEKHGYYGKAYYGLTSRYETDE